jgi:hypothetical protein
MHFDEELHKLIAKRAHEMSIHRNGDTDDPESNWIKAEQEILDELRLRSEYFTENQLMVTSNKPEPDHIKGHNR